MFRVYNVRNIGNNSLDILCVCVLPIRNLSKRTDDLCKHVRAKLKKTGLFERFLELKMETTFYNVRFVKS